MSGIRPVKPLSPAELQSVFERTLDGATLSYPVVPAEAEGLPPHQIQGDEAASLSGLMRLADADFIRAAYQMLLKRAPDQEGLRIYLANLGRGMSRITVLGDIRYSPEGRSAAVDVPGLRTRVLLHRLYRIPVLGRVLRSVTAVVALPGLFRDVDRVWMELRATQNLLGDIDRVRAALISTQDRISQIGVSLNAALSGVRSEIVAQAERTLAIEQGLLLQATQVTEQLNDMRSRLADEAWSEPIVLLADRVDAQAAGMLSVARSVEDRLDGIKRDGEERVAALQQAMREHLHQAGLMLDEAKAHLGGAVQTGAPAPIDQRHEQLLDDLYLAFENRFRGSRDDIKQRLGIYLDVFVRADAGAASRPIVDVGCGRGELLEILQEKGLKGRGVDCSSAMVSYCQAAGFDATLEDGVSYLDRLDAESVGAVTAFHVIEHLPFPALVALFDASFRALAPGGLIIFETPNPANLLVASRWFYLDPTHLKPLPAEMVAMIAEARGFAAIEVLELHPMQNRFETDTNGDLPSQLDVLFHGPQDYALIARKL
jgi:O-antigen chain-terminating methyltransferase